MLKGWVGLVTLSFYYFSVFIAGATIPPNRLVASSLVNSDQDRIFGKLGRHVAMSPETEKIDREKPG